MTPSKPAPRWQSLRLAVFLTLALSVMVGASSVQDAVLALSVESVTPREPSLGSFKELLPYPKEQEAAIREQERATLAAIESMAEPRAALFVGLACAAMVLFVLALQLRWALERPPVRLAKRAALVATIAAVLRTLAGAQDLVIARHAAAASTKVLVAAKIPEAEATTSITLAFISAASIGWTLVVVALFMGLASYYRSPKVQAASFVEDDDDDEG